MYHIPFLAINWNHIEEVEFPGENGTSFWKTIQLNGLRIRIVEYKAGYIADHWCEKGHIVHCIHGEFTMKLAIDEEVNFSTGMSFVVSDNLSSHLSISENGAKLLIIDGDFLNAEKSVKENNKNNSYG